MMNRLKNILRHNFKEKVIALIVATVLWFFVMDKQNPIIEGSYSVPLTATGTPRGFKAFYPERQIKVNLRAPRSMFAAYTSDDIRAFVNLTGFVEGSYDVEVNANYPQGFEFVSANPDTVHVQIDPFVERPIPAETIVTGSTAGDSVVREIKKSQDMVTVVGPGTLVATVTRVIGYVGLSENSSSFELQVPMTAVNEDGREVKNVRVVPSALTVTVEIESGVRKKTVPIVAELNTADGWEISDLKIDTPQTEIAGIEELLEQTVTLKTVPANIPAGQRNFKQTLSLEIPDGITSKVTEVEVSATIKRTPIFRTESNATE